MPDHADGKVGGSYDGGHGGGLGAAPTVVRAPAHLEAVGPAGLGRLGVGGVQHHHIEQPGIERPGIASPDLVRLDIVHLGHQRIMPCDNRRR
jgi:hypothetical protein